MFSQIKDRKHIERNFHFVAWVMPQGWDFGVLKGQLWPAFSAIGIGEHYFSAFKKKNVIRIRPPLAKLSGSAHDFCNL